MNSHPGLLARIDRSGMPLLLARLAVGGWFAYLSLRKLSNPAQFLKDVHSYGFFPTQPPELLNTLALMLPYLELLCALVLILGLWRRAAATMILGMLLFFGPLLVVRALGIQAEKHLPGFCWVKFDCGCGNGEVYICRKLAENAALSLGALVVMFSRSSFLCLGNLFARPRAAPARQTALSGASA